MDTEVIPLLESFGITVVGSYRDLSNETGYLWIRRFDDLEQKEKTTTAVYESPAWVDDLHGRVLDVMDDPSTAVVTVVRATPRSHLA